MDMDFLEDQFDQEIEAIFPYQDEAIKQEYSRPKEKHYRDSAELRKITTSEVVHTFLLKLTGKNKNSGL